jgi:O-succinylbenzoate synthase
MVRGETAIACPTSCVFEFRPYQRRFQPSLKTRYGEWRDRTGILLKLTASDGRTCYGEIAPLPEFGSETLEAALVFCQHLPKALDQAAIAAIPDTLPACQFGFETAWSGFNSGSSLPRLPISGLLPTGEAALSTWEALWQAGFRTLKWKIGVAPLAQELAWFHQLQRALPKDARLRLDANGALSLAQAQQWLEVCDRAPVEYLEQPLPPSQFDDLLSLSAQAATTIALDESVATLHHLKACLDRGWRGVMVIKPAIAGSPTKLGQLLQTHTIDAVFSSVFETPIGWQAGLHLAAEFGNRDRATGYGTTHWFNDSLQTCDSFDDLWQRL